MRDLLVTFVVWLGSFTCEKDGKPSMKRVGFAMTVTMLTLIMGVLAGVMCGVVYASSGHASEIELVRILSGTLDTIVCATLTAVTGGYLGGKHIDKKESP